MHLLGRPNLVRDGLTVAPPKGRKAWAVLALVICSEGNVTREQLRQLLFADADDPGRALRWNLTEIRRSLGPDASLGEDPLVLNLEPGSFVDVEVIRDGTWMEAISLPGLGKELLAGSDPKSSVAFDMWLVNQRRHLKASSEAILREAALAQLAAGNSETAIDLAARLVAVEPYEEAYQSLLIRSYAGAGDGVSAARQLAACVEMFRRDLGVEPGPTVTSAIRVPLGATTMAPISGVAAARAQLEAGEAAMKAGALDAGLECFRKAVAEAHSLGDIELKSRTLFAMGSALVHCGQARYEEGAAALHQAIVLASRTNDRLLSAAAHRELAWVELLTARYGRVEVGLREARSLADGDEAETARILFVLGMAQTEVSRYAEGIAHLEGSVILAESVNDRRQLVLSLSMLGKAHLMRRELSESRRALERAFSIVRAEGWTWLSPWTTAYLGELELIENNLQKASELFEHAFAMAVQIGDPCLQCKAEAGYGSVQAVNGNIDAAVKHLEAARMRLIATPDHTWTMVYALDALCEVGITHRLPQTERWVNDLETVAARSGMRELLARSYMHRFRLGHYPALETARLLSSEIDNPYLNALIREAEATVHSERGDQSRTRATA